MQLNDYLKPCFSKHDILRSNPDNNNKPVKDVAKLNNAFNSPLNSKKYKKILQKPLPEFRINDLEKFKKNVYNQTTTTDHHKQSKGYKSTTSGQQQDSDKDTDHEQNTNKSEFSQEISEAANHINFITNHMKTENDYQEVHKIKLQIKLQAKKITFSFHIL